MNRDGEVDSHSGLEEFFDWFQYQRRLLAGELARILLSLGTMRHQQDRLNLPFEERESAYLTVDEAKRFFARQAEHLDWVTMLGLLALAEGILRRDFDSRVKAKRKDALSRHYRDIQRRCKDRVTLRDHLLPALRECGAGSLTVDDFTSVLRLRDWLAHGRHWTPRLARNYTPEIVFDISRRLLLAALRA